MFVQLLREGPQFFSRVVPSSVCCVGIASVSVPIFVQDFIAAKGLKYIPPSPVKDLLGVLPKLDAFCRRARLRWFFGRCASSKRPKDTFRIATGWDPFCKDGDFREALRRSRHDVLVESIRLRENRASSLKTWTPADRLAIDWLAEHDDICVLDTDKNLGFCLADRVWVHSQCVSHLTDFDRIDDVDLWLFHVRDHYDILIKSLQFPEGVTEFLLQHINSRVLPRFRIIAKIH